MCGHILAGRTFAPLAYMLPIETIFEDIKRVRGAKDIRLSPHEPALLFPKETNRASAQSDGETTKKIQKREGSWRKLHS